jgi:Zn-finger nucleic acid-binding protein
MPANSIICDYCGTRNDTDLKGVHKYTVTVPHSERICPRCNISISTIDLKINGKFLIERCDQCLGLFFDPGELEALLKASVQHVYNVNHHKLNELNKNLRRQDFPAAYIKCPVCSKIMNRVNFGAKSGVIIDRCSEHGIWLDGGELRHLLEWVKAGGEILDRQRTAEHKKIDAELEKQRNRDTARRNTRLDSYTGFSHYGGTLKNEDPVIFNIIWKVAKWLIS